MDHVYESMEPYLEAEFDYFISEWKTGEYKKYSEVPNYEDLKTIIDAANIIRKKLGWELISIRGRLEFCGLLNK